MRKTQKSVRGGLLATLVAGAVFAAADRYGISWELATTLVGLGVTVANAAYRELRQRWPALQEFDPILIGDEAVQLADIDVTLELSDGQRQQVRFGVGISSLRVPVGAHVAAIELAPAKIEPA